MAAAWQLASMEKEKPDVRRWLAEDVMLSQEDCLLRIRRARRLSRVYNALPVEDDAGRLDVLRRLLGSIGRETFVDTPFHCDHGVNVFLGSRIYIGMNCVFVDVANIEIGDGTLIASGVNLSTATHPVRAAERVRAPQDAHGSPYRTLCAPIRIGRNCWIGANVTILPGVSIGDNTTVGAGSVVNRDLPADCLAVGVPCRVIRNLAESSAPPER